MDSRHRHNLTWAEAESDTDEFAHQAYAGAQVRNDFLSLKEPSLVAFHPQRDDKLNIAITSVFPSAVFVQISDSRARPHTPPPTLHDPQLSTSTLRSSP